MRKWNWLIIHPDLLKHLFGAGYKQRIEDNAITTYHDTKAIWWYWCKHASMVDVSFFLFNMDSSAILIRMN